jgi:hypothetical protein
VIPLLADVVVHIASEEPVSLQRAFADPVRPNRRKWVTICTSPCDRELPEGFGYRIAGSGIRSSEMFAIDGKNVTVAVDPGSNVRFIGGLVTLGVGGGAAMLGLGVLALSQMSHSSEPRDQTIPVTLAIGGGLIAVVGSVLLLTSGTAVSLTHHGVALTPNGIVF